MARKYTDKQKTAQDSRVTAFAATLERRKGTEQQKKEAWELSARLTKESAKRFAAARQHRLNMDRECHACGNAFADGSPVYGALDGASNTRIGLLCGTCAVVIRRVAPLSVGGLVESAPVAEEDTEPTGDTVT